MNITNDYMFNVSDYKYDNSEEMIFLNPCLLLIIVLKEEKIENEKTTREKNTIQDNQIEEFINKVVD